MLKNCKNCTDLLPNYIKPIGNTLWGNVHLSGQLIAGLSVDVASRWDETVLQNGFLLFRIAATKKDVKIKLKSNNLLLFEFFTFFALVFYQGDCMMKTGAQVVEVSGRTHSHLSGWSPAKCTAYNSVAGATVGRETGKSPFHWCPLATKSTWRMTVQQPRSAQESFSTS